MSSTEPNRSDNKRVVDTMRSYQGKVTGYLERMEEIAPRHADERSA